MKIKITGWNYEGAKFRGIPSDTDEVLHTLEIEGSEYDITNTILENYSYGADEDVNISLARLCAKYKRGLIPNGDGCGGILKIEKEGVVLFQHDDCEEILEFENCIDLGITQADFDLNTLVVQKIQ